jgi:hypothetical protein
MTLQHINAFTHVIGVIVAAVIIWRLPSWRHFGYMLATANVIGAMFYVSVFYFPAFDNHTLSQYRTLIITIVWVAFGVGLFGCNDGD